MKLDKPYFIIDLNDNKIIFLVILFNEQKNFKILKKIILESSGIKNGHIIDIEIVSQLLKKNINNIEEEINYFFSDVAIIINPNEINCLNVSGYKKLNGSQVSNEDVIYILNNIKKIILENEINYFLVHLFNSNFSLDSDNLENLPIGLFGDFYNQNMTFFLVNKNIIKNIKLVFNNCGLNIEKIILKPFAESVYLLSHNLSHQNFTILRLGKESINVSLFKNKSFVFTENFDFGFNLINKDISKLCTLKIEEVENLLKEVELKNIIEINNESFLDKKYFYVSPYRKIKYQLILDVFTARLEELFEICYKKNNNIKKSENNKIYVYVDSSEYFKNIRYVIEKNKLTTFECIFDSFSEYSLQTAVLGASEIIGKGWEKEAIPIIYKKKSYISGFFSKLFS